jgi:hypothetical protein
MMALEFLKEHAKKRGSYPIRATFTGRDGDGNIFTIDETDIKTLKWNLSDIDGNIINNREEEEISSITNPYFLVLGGDDLGLLAGEEEREEIKRRVSFEGTYDSIQFGNDQELVVEIGFVLDNVKSNTTP